MPRHAKVMWACVLLLAMQRPLPSGAAAPEGTTARITLRDDHVEAILELDLLALIGAVDPAHRAPGALATLDERTLAASIQRARDLLQAGSRLTIDGSPQPLLITAFPRTPDVRFMATRAAADPRARRELVALRLEAIRPVPGARTVGLALPKEAGPVHYTFTQPATRLVAAGDRTSFTALADPRATPPTR